MKFRPRRLYDRNYSLSIVTKYLQEKTVLRKGSTAILNGTLKDVTMNKGNRSMTQSHIVLPHATLDLSNGFNGTITAKSLELSTLV